MNKQQIFRHLTKASRSLYNLGRYGIGPTARQRKKAAKARRREVAFFDSDVWRHDGTSSKRAYGSYEHYVQHQGAKLDEVMPRLHEKEIEDLAEFKRRFETCPQLKEARSVLCLGASIGTEVKALHALGYFAVGVDLNPGEANQYVLPGDFHRIVFPDGALDAIYTNALDHAFDLKQMISEVRRLLRPDGLFIVDLLPGYDEGFVPGAYESIMWRDQESFLAGIRKLGSFTIDGRRDLGRKRRDEWTQVVFRKPA